MQDREERARSQLMAIELTYGIKIKNRDETARIIADRVKDPRQILTICTSLNSWIAVNGYQGEVAIPGKLLKGLLDGT